MDKKPLEYPNALWSVEVFEAVKLNCLQKLFTYPAICFAVT